MTRRGFSLVEMLVALVIFSVGILAVIQMTLMYVKMNAANFQFSQALAVTQSKMEELKRYSQSDRRDLFAPFDFDYVTSTAEVFTTIYDPDKNTETPIPGLLAAQTPVDYSWGSTTTIRYDSMNDNGQNGDVTAGDGIWTNSDVVNVTVATTPGNTNAPVIQVNLLWTVTPEAPPPNPPVNFHPSYAKLNVEGTWTDKQGQHKTRLESLIFRRQ